MSKQIKDLTQVVSPALTDVYVCQQGGVTYKATADQILGLISAMTASGTIDGTEVTVVRQAGLNKKATLADIAAYIISQA